MKKTRQKQVVLDIINNSYEHLTAYGVYEKARLKIPNISLGTVYRNLNTFVEEQIIKKIVVDGESDRFDRLSEHVHFICNYCHQIVDIFDYKIDKRNIILGNKVMNYEIILRGICQKCQEEE